MEVVVAGAGSIGLLIGSYLAEAGMRVVFLVRREEQASIIRKDGIRRVNGDGSETVVEAGAQTNIDKLPENAPWIVATKYGGVAPIVEDIVGRNLKNPVMFIQNGYGHFEFVSKTAIPNVFFATVEHGAGRLDDRSISHNGIGTIKIAPYRGDTTSFDFMKNVDSSSFPVTYANDAHKTVLRKVLINCMINPLTAILQVRNGELVENRYAKSLFDQLFNEIMEAFPEMQNDLSKTAVEEICMRTAKNRSSMLTDRLNGNPMEIDTVVSSVIRMGERRGSQLAFLQTLEKMLLAIDRG
ncbi:2-dehydropantoate 2-reductase [Sporosarcina sp. ACRSL]|uniref:ketopantoate reductase family protein n=1 Tax=Sporosarcina sp. ACRSL TaxID=2918215 RepID=UPI001EF61A31|nr:2-dehydropantoate 2-reductase [Sporosarcina sp. ACRSL]MCG7342773.1 2-dehydropantoate 2-reductase [Sporosarcina sp. ACRSL]